MAFRKGGEEAAAASKSAGGGKFAKVHYLSMGDGEQVVVRYHTDVADWVFVDQHVSAPTKNKPKDYEGNWPATMPATCRYDEGFEGKYTDCYIDDAGLLNKWNKPCKPAVRVWALACLREEVVGTQEMFEAGEIEEAKVGKRIGFKDSMREIDERDEKGELTGKTIQERAMVVVNMATNNYFDGLRAMSTVYEGTICDRDYVVKREGTGTDTDYNHIPHDPTPNLKPGLERWAKYDDAVRDQNLDLAAIISDKASDEYYALFFDPNKEAPARGKKDGEKSSGSGSDSAPVVPEKAESDVSSDRLAEMRDRVRGGAKSAASSDVD